MSQIEPYLDDLTFRRAHVRLVFSAGLGVFLDGYDSAMMAVAIVFLGTAWHLSPASLGLIGASTLLGAMAGGALGGRCADLYGRKWLYIIDIATFFVAALLSALSWNVASVFLFRFLVGVGIGIDYPLSATFLAEFAPRKQRGSLMTWSFGLFFYVGAIAAMLVGYLLSRFGSDARRLLFASGALPALALLVIRRALPESPRWLLRNRRPEEAIAALRTFQPDCPLSAPAAHDAFATRASQPMHSAWRQLFAPQYLRRTALITLPWFLLDVVDYGYSLYIPTLLLAFGMKTFGGAILLSTLLKCIGTVGFVLVARSIDRIGRIRAQSLGFLGLAAGMAALSLLAAGPGTAIVPIALCMLFVKVCNAFPDITTWILPVELFPTDLRASAHGLATSFSRIGAASSVFLFPILQRAWGISRVLLIIAAAQVLASLLTLMTAYEPAGRSLEDIAPSAALHSLESANAARPLAIRSMSEEP